ncbi:hypothetical protein AN642_00475, partial [Epulopiscium sp. SCG-B10WGA-EpuloA2]
TYINNIDTGALTSAIDDATANLNSVKTSEDGADILFFENWVTQDEKDALIMAIESAQVILNNHQIAQIKITGNTDDNQKQILLAETALNEANAIFNQTKKVGIKEVNKDALITAIDTATKNLNSVAISVDGADIFTYEQWVTQDTKDTLSTAISTAQIVLDNEEATLAEVATAVQNLNTATDTFNAAKQYGSKTVSKEVLIALIETVTENLDATQVSINGEDVFIYKQWVTQNEHNILNQAIDDSQAIVDKPNASSGEILLSSETLFDANVTFNEGKKYGKKSVDKSALITAIENATTNLSSVPVKENGDELFTYEKWVTQAEKDALNTAIETAKALLELNDKTQDEIDEAVTALNDANTTFNNAKDFGTKTVDIEELKLLISQVEENLEQTKISTNGEDVFIYEKWVTQDVKNTLNNSLIVATSTADNITATPEQITDASINLYNANKIFNNAKQDGTKVVSKTALTIAINNAITNLNSVKVSTDGVDIYTYEKWVIESERNTFDTAIKDAQSVEQNENATQEEIDSAVTALSTATTFFNNAKYYGKKVVNKEALKTAITASTTTLSSVLVSTDGSDIFTYYKWVTQAQKNALLLVLSTAEAILIQENVTQSEIDANVTALTNATAEFEKAKKDGKKVVDKEALKTIISTATTNSTSVLISVDGADVYTYKKWITQEEQDTLKAAITAAELVLNKVDVRQEEIDTAVTTLNTANTKFDEAKKFGTQSVDKTILETLITDVTNNLKESAVSTDGADIFTYQQWVTQAEKDTLQTAIDTAQAVFDNADSTPEQITTASADLFNANQTFNAAKKFGTKQADKTALIASLEVAIENLKTKVSIDGGDVFTYENWVIQEVYTTFETAVETAQSVADNITATDEEVNEAKIALDEAIATFEKFKKTGTKPIDKNALSTTIENANNNVDITKVSTNGFDVYTYEKWVLQEVQSTFQQAIETAQAVLDNAAATQPEIQTAQITLEEAIITFDNAKKVGVKTVDKSALITAIENANKNLNSIKKSIDGNDIYTYDQWVTQAVYETFEGAISVAQMIVDDQNATLTEVVAAKDILIDEVSIFDTAKADGKKIVDKDALKKLIETANQNLIITKVSTTGDDLFAYEKWVTQDEHNTLKTAIDAAQDVVDDDAATEEQITTESTKLFTANKTFNDIKKSGKKETDKSALKIGIENANTNLNTAKVSENGGDVFTYEQWVKQSDQDAFNKVIAIAQNIYYKVDATAQEVTTSLTDLETASTTFDEAKQAGTKLVDKTALTTAIATVTANSVSVPVSVDGSDIFIYGKWVTAAEKELLTNAIDVATSVLNKVDVTQQELDDAIIPLNSANTTFNNAKKAGKKTVDKTALATALTEANTNLNSVKESLLGDDVFIYEKWVTESEHTAFETEIKTAQDVYDRIDSSQTEVDKSVSSLGTATTTFNTAKKDGKKQVDKTVLKTTIDNSNTNLNSVPVSIDGSELYPYYQWIAQVDKNAFISAIESAQEVFDNPDATQVEIDNAKTTLDEANTTFNNAKKAGIKKLITFDAQPFTTIAQGESNNNLYQLLKINYDRLDKVESSKITITLKGTTDKIIWAEKVTAPLDQTAEDLEASWQWSYRDASSVLVDGLIPSDDTLLQVEHTNDTLLAEGDVVEIKIEVVKDGNTIEISNDYTITAEDIKNATYDVIAPTITYDGNTTLEVIKGEAFTAPDIIVNDNIDTSIVPTCVITKDGNVVESVDTSELATYTLTYTATDSAGNVSLDPLIITVNIILGNQHVLTFDENIFTTIAKGEGNENPYQLMQINYNRLLDVDARKIIITLQGSTDAEDKLIWGDEVVSTIDDPILASNDAFWHWSYRDASSILVNDLIPNADELSKIELTNDTLLAEGNEVEIKLEVTKDSKTYQISQNYTITADDVKKANYDITKPTITYDGEINIEVKKGDTFKMPVVTATDNLDGDITPVCIITKNDIEVQAVDTSEFGTYKLAYTATDNAGNVSDTLIITVKVILNVEDVLNFDAQPFTAVSKGEVNNNPYQWIQINYNTLVDIDSRKITIILQGATDAEDKLIWGNIVSEPSLADDRAFWHWSYRDASSILVDGVIPSAEELLKIEQTNDTLLSSGQNVEIIVEVVKDGKVYQITKPYMITPADVKNAAYEVDKNTLILAIKTANANLEATKISVDGTDIYTYDKWVIQSQYDALKSAIETAQGIVDNVNATELELINTLANLNHASNTFESNKKAGTKVTDKTALTNLITQAKTNITTAAISIDGSDIFVYNKWVTQAEKNALQTAIEIAEFTANKPTLTQKEIEGAIKALNNANDTFEKSKKYGTKLEDKTALISLINQVNKNLVATIISVDGKDVYTTSKWVTQAEHTTLNNAIKTAQVVEDNTNATSEEIEDAISALTAANLAFENSKKDGTKVIDKTALTNLITQAKTNLETVTVSVDGSDIYTKDKWVTQSEKNALQIAIETAEGIASKETLTQKEIEDAINALTSANTTFENAKKDGTKVANKTALINLITQVKANLATAIISTDGKDVYTTSKWVTQAEHTTLDNAINTAQTVVDKLSATEQEITVAINDLTAANLVFENSKKSGTKTDKTALKNEISSATTNLKSVKISTNGKDVYKSSKWVTQTVYDKFNTAIKTAQAIVDKADATEAEINKAREDLKTATTTFNSAKKNGTKTSGSSGGGSSGGGSSGGSSSSSSDEDDSDDVEINDVITLMGLSTSKIQISNTVKDEKSETKVSNILLERAIEDVLTQAKKTQSMPVLIIDVNSSDEINEVEVEIDSNSLFDLLAHRNASLEVWTDLGNFVLDYDILNEIIQDNKNKDITFEIATDEKLDLTSRQKKEIDDKIAYDLAIKADDRELRRFENDIEIKMEYDLIATHDASTVKVIHVDEDANLEILNTKYSQITNELSFKTEHFSIFMIDSSELLNVLLPFKDILSSAWYYRDVVTMYNNKIMVGMTETSFEPFTKSSRAQIAAILHRLSGETQVAVPANISDVENNAWYKSSVDWAVNNNIFNIFNNALFKPNEKITREELVYAMYNYAKYLNKNISQSEKLTDFIDANLVSSWAVPSMEWAIATGIISGTSETTISPKGLATRAEIAAIINRFLTIY